MENRTTVSYVILKYDKKSDGIYTKTVNDNNGKFKIPNFKFSSSNNMTTNDLKMEIMEYLRFVDAGIDIDHLFIPFVNLSISRDLKTYNYSAIVFESDRDVFATVNNESWRLVQYDKVSQTWILPWQRGMNQTADIKISNSSSINYVANPNLQDDRIDFCNTMHFIIRKMQEFPILGLLSGMEFTRNEVLHYQKLLGLENADIKTSSAFESKYSDSIQAISDNNFDKIYKIKDKYLQK
ncbi:hypothetical protein COSHB9_15500 [Companilactobacillus alimentarius]